MLQLLILGLVALSYADPRGSQPPINLKNYAARMVDVEKPEPQPLGYGVNLNIFNNAAEQIDVGGMEDSASPTPRANRQSKHHVNAIPSDTSDPSDAYIQDGSNPGGSGGNGDCPTPKPVDRLVITNVNVNNIAAEKITGHTRNAPASRNCDIDNFSVLADILSRGQLICGVSTGNQVLGNIDQQGVRHGLDVDMCRAIAAALFEDFREHEGRRVKYLPGTPATRFGLLERGADLVAVGTTKNIKRVVTLPVTFGPVMFYDGAAILVKKESSITDAEEIRESGEIDLCVIRETTGPAVAERNFRNADLVLAADIDELLDDWEHGRCQGAIADFTQFLGKFDLIDRIGGRIVQDVSLSKEPLAPFVSERDPQFARIVDTVLNGILVAMEREVTSLNAINNPSFTLYENEDAIAEELGIPRGFMRRAISAVGNYDELYDRYLGRFFETGVIENRGFNNRNTRCGLLFGLE